MRELVLRLAVRYGIAPIVAGGIGALLPELALRDPNVVGDVASDLAIIGFGTVLGVGLALLVFSLFDSLRSWSSVRQAKRQELENALDEEIERCLRSVRILTDFAHQADVVASFGDATQLDDFAVQQGLVNELNTLRGNLLNAGLEPPERCLPTDRSVASWIVYMQSVREVRAMNRRRVPLGESLAVFVEVWRLARDRE